MDPAVRRLKPRIAAVCRLACFNSWLSPYIKFVVIIKIVSILSMMVNVKWRPLP